MILTKKLTSSFIVLCLGLFFFFWILQDNLVAQIGKEKISEKDTQYQIEIERCYSEQEITKEIALIQLKNKFLEKEVLRMAFGVEVPEEVLKEKAKWVDENTKAPEILECVKNIFMNDRKNYMRLYIQPTLVNPKLHSLFSQSQEIHKNEIKRIEQIYEEIENGEDLNNFSEYMRFNISKQIKLSEIFEENGAEFQENPLVEEVIKNLKLGEIWHDIIEDDYSYQIIRFLKEEEKKYCCDGIIVEKRLFGEWFDDFVSENIEVSLSS